MTKKIFLISAAIVLVLFAVLVVHIALVTGPKAPTHLADVQLARIDFDAPLDSAQAASVRSAVLGLPGVEHVYMNIPAGTMTYSYVCAVQDQHRVYGQVATISPVPCRAFIVEASDLAGSCPAMAQGGVQQRFSSWISELVH